MTTLAWPNVEISERERELNVTAELPGIDEKDAEILLDDVSTLKGQKRVAINDDETHFSERH